VLIMPKIVDHDRQREIFAEAVIRLIARDGFEGMTMRSVAAEAGLSYGSLFHYFDSKDDLLMHAVRHSTAQQTKRVNEYSSQYSGLTALSRLLLDDVLVTESVRDDAVVWLAFSYKAALQDRFAEMHTELIDGWFGRISQLLKSAQESGEIRPEIDTGFEAMAIWAYSAGIGQQGLLHPGLFPPPVQQRLIDGYLDKLR
jgi:AcrR family transcriptional regulator